MNEKNCYSSQNKSIGKKNERESEREKERKGKREK